jgi:predicted house-cleaning noncanonical NTP pyrophosphatase (MazG superfamily)
MENKNIESSGNIFIDLGFTPELAEKLMEEVTEIALRRKNPDIIPLIDLRIKLKKTRAEYRKTANEMGDRRDWDGTTEYEAKVEAYDEVLYLIKTIINESLEG